MPNGSAFVRKTTLATALFEFRRQSLTTGQSNVTSTQVMLNDIEIARKVSNDVLEITAAALLSGDYDGFAARVALPYRIEVEGDEIVCKSPAALEKTFRKAHQHLSQLGVTLFHRGCIAAEFKDKNTILSTHETRLLSRGLLVEDPYPAIQILVRGNDGVWRVQSGEYWMQPKSRYKAALFR